MTTEMKVCAKCGTRSVSENARGRPAVYCSEACRRSAEFEIRRQNNHISRLERRLFDLESGITFPNWNKPAKAIEETREQIAAAEERLLALLAGQIDD